MQAPIAPTSMCVSALVIVKGVGAGPAYFADAVNTTDHERCVRFTRCTRIYIYRLLIARSSILQIHIYRGVGLGRPCVPALCRTSTDLGWSGASRTRKLGRNAAILQSSGCAAALTGPSPRRRRNRCQPEGREAAQNKHKQQHRHRAGTHPQSHDAVLMLHASWVCKV